MFVKLEMETRWDQWKVNSAIFTKDAKWVVRFDRARIGCATGFTEFIKMLQQSNK